MVDAISKPLETMVRVHFVQHWFALSDPAMAEVLILRSGALVDATLMQNFQALSL